MPIQPDPVGRWARASSGRGGARRPDQRHDDQTVLFYRDIIGLPVLERFQGSYREDGTIFGLPGTATQLEIVRSTEPAVPSGRIDSLVFYWWPGWPPPAWRLLPSTPIGRRTAA